MSLFFGEVIYTFIQPISILQMFSISFILFINEK
ncbi:putative membrane protein, partial [Clostridioides difficile CD129]